VIVRYISLVDFKPIGIGAKAAASKAPSRR